MNYKQARKDHEYLWAIGPAYDMTGGYVDQEDLERLLKCPTKAMATKCYHDQICYWFDYGCEDNHYSLETIPWDDPMVVEIAERHGINTPWTLTEEIEK